MAIYQIDKEKLTTLRKTTFSDLQITEKEVQRLLRDQIEIISEDTMVISEEFSGWEESKRRIDLLCIDKEANLVVVELKRTEDGGFMDLQAIRYSAMVSTMTFAQVVEAHRSFLERMNSPEEPKQNILEFLGWSEPNEESFAQDVRIVLASLEFSKELTSAVIWLNDKGLDIRCVKMEPYFDGEKKLLDVQQVIPLSETADYQIEVRRKKQSERQSKKDFSKFSLSVDGKEINGLNKRNLMYEMVSAIIQKGAKPEQIQDELNDIKKKLFVSFEGSLNKSEFKQEIKKSDKGGQVAKFKRYFCDDGQLFYCDNRTFALTNQWGNDTTDASDRLCSIYSNIEYRRE